jgi:hypothetical protein
MKCSSNKQKVNKTNEQLIIIKLFNRHGNAHHFVEVDEDCEVINVY